MDAIHPKRDLPQPEQKSPAIADEKKQSTPSQECQKASTSPEETVQPHHKVKLVDVNSSLTCELCKGYLIDATTISECLHSFCRSCIIKFLQENSFCPVCEVIINKAKPNLKLDKTLQDIVYKLVPGLFLSEMMRRRRFYADKPAEAGRTSPEQRGEDTERTIFNPQDKISLSLEYIGDEATTGLILKDLKKEQNASEDLQAESLLKRYLQCPAMCRIDVIKKFIRNKYNVNTDIFQIDILYKRVPLPLPDHYTLVDVAYIYTWKRNEPMRFYFRIIDKGNDELPDLTKVFTPVDEAPFMPKPLALSTPNKPVKIKENSRKTPKRCSAKKLSVIAKQPPRKDLVEEEEICDKKERNICESDTPKKANHEKKVLKKEDAEEDVKKEHESPCDEKVYTNITLNRSNNLEIVTKIQKLSDKDVKQIEVNVIDQSSRQKIDANETVMEETETKSVVKQEEPSTKPVIPKEEPSSSKETKQEPPNTSAVPSTKETAEDIEKTKFEFLKSIELTSKKVVGDIAKLVQQQQQNNSMVVAEQQKEDPAQKLKKPPTKTEPNGLKRKNSSPMRIEPKKPKLEPKRTTKIILQQKPGFPPLNLLKPAEKNLKVPEQQTKNNRKELMSLFQTCKLNIPSSLSITLKENGESSRQQVQMAPVQNFIEILKIDEKSGAKRDEVKNAVVEVSDQIPKNVSASPAKKKRKEEASKELHSFQKIFEESIKKNDTDGALADSANDTKSVPKPVTPLSPSSAKLVMTQKLQKIAIPRVNNQRMMKTPKKSPKYEIPIQQTLANLHSSSLGLNYTVSVAKQPREMKGFFSPPKMEDRSLKASTTSVVDLAKSSPRPVEVKTETDSPKQPKTSPPPVPKKDVGCLQIPMSSPRIFSPTTSSKTASPRPKSRTASPKPWPNVSSSSTSSSGNSGVPPLSANELLEKYNIQNLAQLSASMNYNAQAYLSTMSNKQMTALHQSMLMKQIEAQNRQNWFNINPIPLLQYEKYLQTLTASKNQIMGNLKEN